MRGKGKIKDGYRRGRMGEGGQQIMGGKEEREEDDGKEREVGTKRRVRWGHKVSYSIHNV